MVNFLLLQVKSVETWWKALKKGKNQPKRDYFEVPSQGVDQLLHVNQLWVEDKTTFFCSFSDIFVDFSREITEKALKWTKKVEKRLKKMFWLAFRCCKHLKAGRNTQQMGMGKVGECNWNLFQGLLNTVPKRIATMASAAKQ